MQGVALSCVDLSNLCVTVDLEYYPPASVASYDCLNSPPHCPAPRVLASLAVLKKIKRRKKKELRKMKMKADYAISTHGDLYICTVNVFYFDFILLEKETRENNEL